MMTNQAAYEARRRLGDSTEKINRTVNPGQRANDRKNSPAARLKKRVGSALDKANNYTFNDMQQASQGFGAARMQTAVKDVKDAVTISGRKPVTAAVNPVSKARVAVVNPKAGVPESQAKVGTRGVSSHDSVAGLNNALQRQFDQTAGGRDFVSSGGNMITGKGFDGAANRQRLFRQKMGGLQRQIDFTRAPMTGTGGAARRALSQLGRDTNPDPLVTSPQRSVRLPFANERSNPFVAGINKDGVTYARGSRMDRQQQHDALTSQVRQRNPLSSDQQVYEMTQNADTRALGGYRGEMVAQGRERIQGKRNESQAQLKADAATATQNQANKDREFNFDRMKFGADKIIGNDGNAYSNKDRIAAYNARPDNMAEMGQADFEYQTYGKVSEGMSGDYLEATDLVEMIEGGGLDQGSVQGLLARTRDPERRALLSKQLEDYFNQQGGA